MKSSELRKEFLEFFKSKGHAIVPSDSLIPANDPSLLFTGAGMNQFKDYFLGLKKELKRAASCQKCFRTGDVEQVGQTASHLTFFEMLGNFSFGDYFKKEAILWAWEFMTVRLKIPKEKLWATVYEQDEEAAELWKKEVGLPPERIVRMGAKDNFWPSNAPVDGPNGPCGPCSELHYDYGRCTVGKKCPDPDRCGPGCPCGRFVEVWNLVFTQYDRQPDGRLAPLPAPNIDTGMGLERLTAVMQDKASVFETDLFAPLVSVISNEVRDLAFKSEISRPFRARDDSQIYAIADHVRALTFLISEGVVPSNDGRGYVLRMLLRKAVRAGQSCSVVFSKPYLYKLVPLVAKIMGEAYPELVQRRESISQVIKTEEERFLQTLEEKLPLLEAELQGKKALDARAAARFYDTHGLSYEEIGEVCRKLSVQLPDKGLFEKALEDLQARSKSGSSFGAIFSKDALAELLSAKPATEFTGYGHDLTVRAKVLCLVQEGKSVQEVKAPAPVEVILDRSPFYGESGGQVGDEGMLVSDEGRFRVEDTQWVGSVLVHRGELLEGRLRTGGAVDAGVDAGRRRRTAQNHTATHLLHSALRKVLGEHVMQAGSLVAPDHLRLDFSHGKGLTPEQRKSVEETANEWISSGLAVSTAQMSLEEARRSGATALFGEKYGAHVRVVSIGGVSKELCGGTHLDSSSPIGLLTLVEEGSVAAGVRRVEALTGLGAFGHLKGQSELLGLVGQKLKAAPAELPQAVDRLLKKTKELEDELQRLKSKETRGEAQKLSGRKVGAFTFFAERLEDRLNHAGLRSFADALRQSEPEAVIFLADQEGFCLAFAGKKAQEKGVAANQLLKLSTEIAGGSGGGRPDMAQGRVNEPEKFPEVKKRLERFIEERS